MLLYVRRGLRNIFRALCCLRMEGRRLSSGLLVGRGGVDSCMAGGGSGGVWDHVWGCVRVWVRGCVCVVRRVGSGRCGMVGGAAWGAWRRVGEGEMAEVGG